MKHIHVYDINMNLVAILDKAYKIGYALENNNIWTCHFTLPLNDTKRHEVTVKRFIELWDHEKYIGKFIIQPTKTVKNDNDRSITYTCEHVLGTLHSEVLFRYHQFTNFTTRQVLQALIDMQEVKHWNLGIVEFERFFHYAWENEDSLLNGIISVPKPFNESYLWDWDDTVYPFILNLVVPDDEKVDDIRYRKNLKGIDKEVDPYNIVNRIYPLGYGEGINQLGIEKVNSGVPYLEDAESIAKYGIHKRVWVDRRFEDATSLKASGQAILDENKEPKVTVSVDCIDYELIDPYKLVKYEISKIVGVKDEDTDTDIDLRIMKISKSDIYGNPSDIKFDLGNVREDLNTTITDLQKKQLVNETYSQGSTNIDSHDYSDNCDSLNPAVIRFYLPDDLVNVNTMTLTYEVEEFRAYSQATEGGGATVQSTSSGGAVVDSTSSGGASTQTSSSGGNSTQTSTSGGGGTVTSNSGGGTSLTSGFASPDFFVYSSTPLPLTDVTFENHYHSTEITDQLNHAHSVTIPNHSHDVSVPNHSHSVTIPAHTHSVDIPAHTHSINIPNHTHDITLPDHVHDIKHGIYKLSTTPASVEILVDGNSVPITTTSGQDIDIIPFLSVDSGGRINRGQWHEVTIKPNGLGRVNANIISRLFIQSRIGGLH
ncbi:phage tail spike protein [Metabacillus herbersteinensis]|uniref:Phage tail spike protein n=1 Tax=Metabacillus herbersteinensis TaxID=283816 RepID=A0ABV6GC49_9BACI